MASIARTSLRTALCPTASSSSLLASTSAIASTSKLPLTVSRYNSTASTPDPSSSTSPSATADDITTTTTSPTPVRYTYFVPRVGKTLLSLPVYTDVRNGGTRTMTELRKIQGSVSDLKTDLSLFLAETYEDTPTLPGFEANKKPLKPKAGRKVVERTGNPSYMDPVQQAKVGASGKLKIRGNRVDEVKAFLESRGF